MKKVIMLLTLLLLALTVLPGAALAQPVVMNDLDGRICEQGVGCPGNMQVMGDVALVSSKDIPGRWNRRFNLCTIAS